MCDVVRCCVGRVAAAHLRLQPQQELTLCSVKSSCFLLFLPLISCLRPERGSFVRTAPLVLSSPSSFSLFVSFTSSCSPSSSRFLCSFPPRSNGPSWPLSLCRTRGERMERSSNCFGFFDGKALSAVCFFCETLLTSAVCVSN